ncbi:DUF169 domain-containing protein [Methanosphaera sp. ISO3-F5]|uniref:DUF169 domain-containing protein n=1 Tax=Methanosphaera sp. ISO3-F5 TaxID=1452353 RepID=UPI002B25FF9F|nr:DUF169 domain-containing protein [Methanosphaera sp. ISO3-F5]WQH65311.1 DUF169 domain-containing protein [Methanosphaera sp. ISO3-F5]
MATLGLINFQDEFKEGISLNKMNVLKTQEIGKKFYKKIPKMDKPVEAIAYMPLENAPQDIDLIVIIAKPRQIFDLIRAHAYANGERIECDVGGTQSLCGDITVNTYKTNEAKISFGCMGSHMATELKEDQVIISIPANQLEEITEALIIQSQHPKQT